jgi:hypothetical protein
MNKSSTRVGSIFLIGLPNIFCIVPDPDLDPDLFGWVRTDRIRALINDPFYLFSVCVKAINTVGICYLPFWFIKYTV